MGRTLQKCVYFWFVSVKPHQQKCQTNKKKKEKKKKKKKKKKKIIIKNPDDLPELFLFLDSAVFFVLRSDYARTHPNPFTLI